MIGEIGSPVTERAEPEPAFENQLDPTAFHSKGK